MTFTVSTDKLDYAPNEVATITASGLVTGTPVQFQILNYGVDGLRGTKDDYYYTPPWVVTDGLAGDGSVDAGVIQTTWLVGGMREAR